MYEEKVIQIVLDVLNLRAYRYKNYNYRIRDMDYTEAS
jgi:hypothetical protein